MKYFSHLASLFVLATLVGCHGAPAAETDANFSTAVSLRSIGEGEDHSQKPISTSTPLYVYLRGIDNVVVTQPRIIPAQRDWIIPRLMPDMGGGEVFRRIRFVYDEPILPYIGGSFSTLVEGVPQGLAERVDRLIYLFALRGFRNLRVGLEANYVNPARLSSNTPENGFRAMIVLAGDF